MRSIAIRSPARPIRRARRATWRPASTTTAIEDFNAALNVDSNNAAAWAGLGLAYEKQGNKAKAVESYNRAMIVDPNNAQARAGVGRLS